jgi:hypothetical protein
MKKKTISIALCCLLTTSLFARINETAEQCIERYGKPKKILEETKSVLFTRAGFVIVIDFYDGKSDQILFRKIATDEFGLPEELSTNEIELLLQANSGGGIWEKQEELSIDQKWLLDDLSRYAQYQPSERILIIATDEYIERAQKNKKEEESSRLESF